MSELIISVSGLRGVVGEALTPEVAAGYAAAMAATAPPGPLVIGRDSRPSGRMLAEAIHRGLAAVGRDTLDAGIVATPTLGVLVRRLAAAGGIQITASHNPLPYNGLKLFSAEGRVIPAAMGEKVLAVYRRKGPEQPPRTRPGDCPNFRVSENETVPFEARRPGQPRQVPDTLADHLEAVLATVDVQRIRRRQFRVLLDANHGAGSLLGRRLLESLHCRLTILGEPPDGQFAHTPEPTAENLAGVLAAVTQVGADVGFCQDPDADRLAVIDASGRYLGEEYTVALCVEHVLRHATGDCPDFRPTKMGLSPSARAIVTNCSSSRMSEDLAGRHGAPFFRSAVGEANVVDAMLAHGALFGGEGNGGPIDPRVGLVRDSFVGMALLLDAMAERELPIGRLADELPRYEIVKTKISLAREKVSGALDALQRHFAGAAYDRLDGLRLDWPGRWLLVRASNTEPIVRAIAEAPTAAEARRLCDDAAGVLGNV
ncbi:MAG: phosphoglucosamine mutase [Thermoguttaceae bacterium]|jgi:phosphomannomutase